MIDDFFPSRAGVHIAAYRPTGKTKCGLSPILILARAVCRFSRSTIASVDGRICATNLMVRIPEERHGIRQSQYL
jgi:hypothetical protein